MAFCAAMLAPSYDAKASALGIGDSHELGFLWPGIQKKTANQDKVNYVNHLIGMALGTIEIAKGEVYFRSSHGFPADRPLTGLANSGNLEGIPDGEIVDP